MSKKKVQNADTKEEMAEAIKEAAYISPEKIDGNSIMGRDEANLFFRVEKGTEEEKLRKALEDADLDYDTFFLADDNKDSWGKITFEINLG